MTREEYVDWCIQAYIDLEGPDIDIERATNDLNKMDDVQLASEYRWLDYLLDK